MTSSCSASMFLDDSQVDIDRSALYLIMIASK